MSCAAAAPWKSSDGDDARVVALAGRVEHLGLARLGAGADVRQADGGVGRRDHGHVGLVQDRDLERSAARVERADHADDVFVAGVPLGVGRAGRRIPLRRSGGRVVDRLVLDGVVARRAALLLQVELHGLHERLGLGARSTLQRQVADDLEVAAGRCRRGRLRLRRSPRRRRALPRTRRSRRALGLGARALDRRRDVCRGRLGRRRRIALVVVTACRDQGDDGDQHERQEPLPPDFHAPPFVVHAPPYCRGLRVVPGPPFGPPSGTTIAGVYFLCRRVQGGHASPAPAVHLCHAERPRERGGTVDAAVSKTAGRQPVWVRLPPLAWPPRAARAGYAEGLAPSAAHEAVDEAPQAGAVLLAVQRVELGQRDGREARVGARARRRPRAPCRAAPPPRARRSPTAARR